MLVSLFDYFLEFFRTGGRVQPELLWQIWKREKMNQQLRHKGIPSKFAALELLKEALDKKLENIFVVFPLGLEECYW